MCPDCGRAAFPQAHFLFDRTAAASRMSKQKPAPAIGPARGLASTGLDGASDPPGRLAFGLFLGLLAVYLLIFFRSPLPSFSPNLSRWEKLAQLIFLPEDYVFHVWFGGSISLLDRLPVMVVAAAILGFAWILGDWLLGLARVDGGLNRLERIVFSFGVGLNTISLYVLAVGLAGRLHDLRAFLMPAGLVLLLAVWRRWRNPRLSLDKSSQGSATHYGKDWLDGRWLWLTAPFLLAIFLGGMLPPIEFDVREYHLEAPKEFYLAGRIEFLPHNVYGNMALGSEMFSLLGMALMGDWWLGALAGKTVIAAFAPLTVLALLAAGRRFFTPMVGNVAALIYISTPWIAHVSTSGLVEGVSALYLILALYAVMLWRQSALEGTTTASNSAATLGGASRLVLAGFLAGAAVSCKYPAVLFVVTPLTAWIVVSAGRKGWKPALVFLLAVIAGCGLWFGKNWVLTGNPVYPLLYEWFGGATRTAAKDAQWMQAHYPHGFGLQRLASDLALVVWQSEWLSPLLMPLAALALCTAKYRRAALGLWAFFAYVVAAWWLMTHRVDRFWIPALPVVALLAGLGATWAATRAWRRLIAGLLLGGMALNLLFVVSPHPGFYSAYFVSLADLRDNPSRVGDSWHLYLNDHVPRGWQVLAVGDAEVFDMEPKVIYNTVFDDSAFEGLCQNRRPEQLRAELLKRRISHIYVHWSEIRRYRQPGNYGFPESIDHACFDRLVQSGVLDPPLSSRFNQGEVYAVRGAAELTSAGELDSESLDDAG